MSRTSKKLTKIFEKAPTFDPFCKYVFISDTHRGDGEKGSDDFLRNAPLYHDILKFYYSKGYTLVLIGDIEELWECNFPDVYNKYRFIYDLEKKFHDEGRLVRIVGNHDFPWYSKKSVEKYLDPIFPGIKVFEGIKIGRVLPKKYGEAHQFFVCHGHQGELLSDILLYVSKFFVRFFWKPFQFLFRVSATSAATNYKKRSCREKEYCEWSKKSKASLIVGHTHRPRIFTISYGYVFNGYNPEGGAFVANDGCAVFPDRSISVVELNYPSNYLNVVLFYYNDRGELSTRAIRD